MFTYLAKSDEKKRWLFASTLLNAFLAAAKLTWGWYMGSTLVTADGIHSISDVFGALLIFLALFFAAHKSERFPYGLHKLEDMAAVIGGLGILFAGYEIVHSVFFEAGIKTPENIWTTIGFILVIIAIQYLFYYYELKASKRLKSPGVKADAINWLGDIGAGFIVVVGLVANHFHVSYAQEVAVVIIVLMIFQGAYDVLKEGLLSLLDAADIDLSKQMRNVILSYPDITQIKRLFVRKSGSVYFADIELGITDSVTKKAHQTIDSIVQKLHTVVPELEAVTVHYEPDHSPYRVTATLLEEDKTHLSKSFGKTAFVRLTKTDKSGTLLHDEIVENRFRNEPRGKAFKLAGWLIAHEVSRIVVGAETIDENVATLFETLNMEIVNHHKEDNDDQFT
ncbi:cation diffusion facilitator family transporter [Sulfurovum sp.]|uniref:cation diffusion facilitator family transporter n=1 Tax=Sulfurovum sp. TaxID=1969726 RepID=UPI0025F8A46D|nr:cation diffusion facilitator family transporter [Sulfurovum sp.]